MSGRSVPAPSDPTSAGGLDRAGGAPSVPGLGPRVHLCLVEPPGYPHSGALLDPLVFFQEQFARAGACVTAGKNELVPGAVNYVFGAHLGFDEALLEEYACVVVNFEQLGAGGAQLPPPYTDLLRRATVVDYHPDNLRAYSGGPGTASLVRLGHARHLDRPAPPLEERDIDVLFLGTLTPRRIRVLRAVEACGQEVSLPTAPVYGPARDDLVRRAKLVLNVGAYETNRFEQVRASVVLSCGTPVVSELRPWTCAVDRSFHRYVHWFDAAEPEGFFSREAAQPAFFDASRRMLAAWRKTEVLQDYADLLRVQPTTPAHGPLPSAPARTEPLAVAGAASR